MINKMQSLSANLSLLVSETVNKVRSDMKMMSERYPQVSHEMWEKSFDLPKDSPQKAGQKDAPKAPASKPKDSAKEEPVVWTHILTRGPNKNKPCNKKNCKAHPVQESKGEESKVEINLLPRETLLKMTATEIKAHAKLNGLKIVSKKKQEIIDEIDTQRPQTKEPSKEASKPKERAKKGPIEFEEDEPPALEPDDTTEY